MKEQWQQYEGKFLTLSPREQYLIILTGLVAVIFISFTLFIDEKLIQINKLDKQIVELSSSNNTAQMTIEILEESLAQDPNEAINKQITQYEKKLAEVDDKLLLLTSDLINPIQMRYALIELLKTQKKVSLLSFEVVLAQEVAISENETKTKKNIENEQSLTLYKHGIKLKLKGSYFALRDYLNQLEKMEWKFFWQDFDYQITEYPNSELQIEMYSLSTKKEFIGV